MTGLIPARHYDFISIPFYFNKGQTAMANAHSTAPLSSLVNHQVRLASRPHGLPTLANWSFTTEAVE